MVQNPCHEEMILFQLMGIYEVGDLHDNFFTQTAGVTAYMNVFVFIRFENSNQLITFKYFISAFVGTVIDDLKIKQFIRPCHTYLKFFH